MDVRARVEVVLSAGAVASPHILLNSGVGPREQLESLGIPVVADLPVGENLQDHMICNLKFATPSITTLGVKSESLPNVLNYVFRRRGPLTSSGVEASLFTETGARPDLGVPDLQIQFIPTGATIMGLHNFTFSETVAELLLRDPDGFVTAATLLHPKSVGTIKLASADPLDHPIIDPNYLSAPDDLETLARGAELAFKIVNSTSTFKNIAIHTLDVFEDYLKTERINVEPYSHEFFAWYVKFVAATVYHPVGTCKMGAASDATAVVLPNLKVKGEGTSDANCCMLLNWGGGL